MRKKWVCFDKNTIKQGVFVIILTNTYDIYLAKYDRDLCCFNIKDCDDFKIMETEVEKICYIDYI